MPQPLAPLRILELRSVRGTGGGPEKTILFGTARTDPTRYAITVCYLRDRRDEVFHIDERARTLPIDYLEIRERHSFDPSIWKQLRALVRDRRIAIVHAHDYKTDLLAWLLARAEPVIPMATAHGWAGHSWKEEWLYYPCDRRILARLALVVAVSSDIRNAILAAGAAPARVIVIPNGIDTVQFKRYATRRLAARTSLGLGSDDLVIGAVGRLESEKNYPLLIRAFATLLRDMPHLRLVIGGDGSLRSRLETLIDELGLGGRCRLLGHVPDVVLLHHALDLFVMCSDNEGSPNAVLEAMALETPIVATDVGGVGDLVQDRREALLVRPRDGTRLTAAMRECLVERDSALARARAARAKVEQEFSFERRMQKVERVYDELMRQHGGVREARRWQR